MIMFDTSDGFPFQFGQSLPKPGDATLTSDRRELCRHVHRKSATHTLPFLHAESTPLATHPESILRYAQPTSQDSWHSNRRRYTLNRRRLQSRPNSQWRNTMTLLASANSEKLTYIAKRH